MITNFIRGGQVSLHYIRMMRQVLHFIYVGAAITILLGTPGYVVMKTTEVERLAVVQYYVAKLKVEIGQSLSDINIVTPSGKPERMHAIVVATYPGMIQHKNWFWHIVYTGFVISFLCVLFVIILLSGFFLWRGKRLSSASHIRGGRIATPKALKEAIKRDNRKQKVKSYTIGGIPYPAFAESQHTFITGSPGAGKTVVISDLIAQIRARGDRAIIYDKMGSYIKWFYRPEEDIILNPLDARSASWSVFNEARSEADFDTIAEALMPTEKGATDPFWTNAARTLFSNVCAVLHRRGITDNKTLLNTILRTDLSVLAKIVKGTPAQAIIDEQSPKTALSVMSVLATNVGAMKFLRDDGKPFSIRKWINDEDASNFLFVTSRADQHASIRPLISTWLEIGVNSLLSLEQSQDRKIWIIIDELPSLHYLPSLQAGLAESRQFGGAFVLSLQVMPQLQAIYGDALAKSTSGLCQTRLVFKSSDIDTANSSAMSLGGEEIEEYKEGMSYGAHEMRDGVNISTNRSTSNLIIPTTILNLPNLTAYLRFGMDYPIAKIDIPYVLRAEIATGFVPASFNPELSVPESLAETLPQEENSDSENIPVLKTRKYQKSGMRVKKSKKKTNKMAKQAVNQVEFSMATEQGQ